MPGKHRTDRHSSPTATHVTIRSLPRRPATGTRLRLLGPVATAAVVTAVFAGGAYAVTQVGDGGLAQDGPSQPTFSPTASAGTSAPPSPAAPAPTPEATAARPPDPVSRGGGRTPTTAATGTVVSTGTCGASFYDEPQGTANGETFDPEALTAAHKTLKFNTRVRVTNVNNGKSVVVRINDRGPYIDGRCIDLSRAAFRAIENLSAGHTTVRYEVLG